MKVKLAAPFMPALIVTFAAGLAMAAPKVVADIPPVHSLASAVMGDTGAPQLILRPGASPHGYAMAPSEADALSNADVVFWVSPTLTPWLDRAIETLATDAQTIALIDANGVATLPFREGAMFEAHDHDHGEHDTEDHEEHEEHGDEEDAHDEHEHEEHAKDEHGHDEGGHDEHGHDEDGHEEEARDPHIWLDPRNAAAMTRAIVAALSEADPANAVTYAKNGEAALAQLKDLEAGITARLSGAKARPFIVFHDAYHYFEARFDTEAAGAIAVSDAETPGPARLTQIRDAIRSFGAPCVFTEPQFPEQRARLVMQGTDARLAVLDPLGADLSLGGALYGELLLNMADAMANCLDG